MKITVQKIESYCPYCAQAATIPSSYVNQSLVCPHCGKGFQLIGNSKLGGGTTWIPRPLPILSVSKPLYEVLHLGEENVMKISYFDREEKKQRITKEAQFNTDLPLLSRSLTLSKNELSARGSKAKVDAQFPWNSVFMVTHVHEAARVNIHYYRPKGKSFRKKKLAWEGCSDEEATRLTQEITDRFPHGHQHTQEKASFWESYSGTFKTCLSVLVIALFYWTVAFFEPEFSLEFGNTGEGRRAAKLAFLGYFYQIFIVAPAYFIPRWLWGILVFGIPILAIVLASYRVDQRMKVSIYTPSSQ